MKTRARFTIRFATLFRLVLAAILIGILPHRAVSAPVQPPIDPAAHLVQALSNVHLGSANPTAESAGHAFPSFSHDPSSGYPGVAQTGTPAGYGQPGAAAYQQHQGFAALMPYGPQQPIAAPHTSYGYPGTVPSFQPAFEHHAGYAPYQHQAGYAPYQHQGGYAPYSTGAQHLPPAGQYAPQPGAYTSMSLIDAPQEPNRPAPSSLYPTVDVDGLHDLLPSSKPHEQAGHSIRPPVAAQPSPKEWLHNLVVSSDMLSRKFKDLEADLRVLELHPMPVTKQRREMLKAALAIKKPGLDKIQERFNVNLKEQAGLETEVLDLQSNNGDHLNAMTSVVRADVRNRILASLKQLEESENKRKPLVKELLEEQGEPSRPYQFGRTSEAVEFDALKSTYLTPLDMRNKLRDDLERIDNELVRLYQGVATKHNDGVDVLLSALFTEEERTEAAWRNWRELVEYRRNLAVAIKGQFEEFRKLVKEYGFKFHGSKALMKPELKKHVPPKPRLNMFGRFSRSGRSS